MATNNGEGQAAVDNKRLMRTTEKGRQESRQGAQDMHAQERNDREFRDLERCTILKISQPICLAILCVSECVS